MTTPSSKDTRRKHSYTVQEFCEAVGIGKTLCYELIKKGAVRSVKIGSKCRRIPVSEVDRLLSDGVA